MLGLDKSSLKHIVEREVQYLPQLKEDSKLKKVVEELIDGVADAIDQNNRHIESRVEYLIDEKLRFR